MLTCGSRKMEFDMTENQSHGTLIMDGSVQFSYWQTEPADGIPQTPIEQSADF